MIQYFEKKRSESPNPKTYDFYTSKIDNALRMANFIKQNDFFSITSDQATPSSSESYKGDFCSNKYDDSKYKSSEVDGNISHGTKFDDSESDVSESDVSESDVSESDVSESDVSESDDELMFAMDL